MDRAVVLIGVHKATGLPSLNAVGEGLRGMARWARSQKINGDRLVVFSDENKPVRVEIFDAISKLVSLRTLEQLIVYFSGHGVHNRGERWLLSGAPVSTSEAVNVEGSIQIARYCGIPHVVLISDACRTAPEGIQSLQVLGTEIFPNDPTGDFEQKVDVLFACARGNPAFEVRDANESAQRYRGVYSDALVECLLGRYGEIVEESGQADNAGVIRADKLHDHLRRIVPARIEKLLGTVTLNQTPDARIVSRNEWVSTVTRRPGIRSVNIPPPRISTPSDFIKDMLGASIPCLPGVDMTGDAFFDVSPAWRPKRPSDPYIAWFETSVRKRVGKLRAPAALDESGVELTGDEIRSIHVPGALASSATRTDHALIRLRSDLSHVNAIIEMGSGSIAVLPVFAEMKARLFIEDGELVDVIYETVIARQPENIDDQVRRAVIAVAAHDGQFSIGEASVRACLPMIGAKDGSGMSLALYCAYACHEAQRRDLIREIGDTVPMSLGPKLFDVFMLSSGQRIAAFTPSPSPAPGFPMLAQGWTLLSAFGMRLPAAVRDLEGQLRRSFWTLFEASALDTLKAAMSRGEL